SVRRDDRCRHLDQQDGPGAAQGLRPDARAALRHLDGLLRQWRRLLSLFLLGRARLRPYRADRHLRAGLSAHRGSAALRRAAASEEDPAHRHHRTLRFYVMDDGKLDALGQTIVSALPGAATGHSVAFNQLTVDVEVSKIV